MEYSIGEFANITGLSIYTLRYYEQEGLIVPARKANGHRRYSENDIKWAEFIKRLKETKMPIKGIKEYAHLRSEGDSTLYQRMEMLISHRERLKEEIEHLSNHLDKLDEKIEYYKSELDK